MARSHTLEDTGERDSWATREDVNRIEERIRKLESLIVELGVSVRRSTNEMNREVTNLAVVIEDLQNAIRKRPKVEGGCGSSE